MSYTVRYKLRAEEYDVVLAAANQLGVDINLFAKQALAYTIQQARRSVEDGDRKYNPTPGDTSGDKPEVRTLETASSDAFPNQDDASDPSSGSTQMESRS